MKLPEKYTTKEKARAAATAARKIYKSAIFYPSDGGWKVAVGAKKGSK
jgi:hypothetical protein